MQFDVVALTSLIVGIGSIITTLALGVKWLTKHYFDEIKHELKPNGGQSIKDQVNRLEKDICEVKDQQKEADQLRKETNKKIDHMYDLLLEYITRNSTPNKK